MSAAKVELGRRLFYDTRLSWNRTQACATCHQQARAFTDGRPRAIGSTGEHHRRNAPSLANVAWSPALTWADPSIHGLEEQARTPMFGTAPLELGLAGHEAEVAARLRAEPLYPPLFRAAFPGEADPVTLDNVRRAIACFERTLVSGDSPYDRLVYGDRPDAMSDAAWRGLKLFDSERLACSRCHGGFAFFGPPDYAILDAPPEAIFANTALYDVDGRGAYPAIDTGLRQVTGRRRDMGRFKVPTLRNVALTAPYMHDGSIATLDEVIDHYAAGGRAAPGASAAGNERALRYRSPLLRGFTLTASEKRDLIEFLRSLTDETFVGDPRFADPWIHPDRSQPPP